MATTKLAPELDALRIQFEHISKDADFLVATLSDEQFHWRKTPDVWTIAECFDHLNATARLYLPQLDEGIAAAIRLGVYSDGPFTYSWLGRIFVRYAEPPARIRMKAPLAFHPERQRTRSEIMAGFRAYQVQFVDRLRQVNGVDLAKARVSPPVLKWLRIPLGCGFELMAAHERRHIFQARIITQAPGFPRG
jgi:hypothetical protein